MKTQTLQSLLIITLFALNGCSAANTESSQPATEAPATETTSIEPETDAMTEEPTEVPTRLRGDYVHGDDGYFNLLEEYPEIEMKAQIGGTCWLFSAANNMETNYRMKTDRTIEIDPMEMLDQIYLDEKEEGFFVQEGINARDFGGSQWIVTTNLSNGFGDLVIDSTVVLDQTDRNAIKEALHNRGSVSIGVNDTNRRKGWFGKYYTLNYKTGEYDHDVTIVGYDDHFPKEYFKMPAEEDGAWIAYNSAFSTDYYFYISYFAPLEYAFSHSISDQYSAVIGYDAGNEADSYISLGDATTTANVFHHAGTLAAVGTYNDFDEQPITIEVYDSSFTNLLYTQEAVLDYHGYQTIVLDTPVEVGDCVVAITYSKGAPVEGEDQNYGQLDYITSAKSGVSFAKLDNWRDLTEDGIKDELGIDFVPGNCCIKALFQ